MVAIIPFRSGAILLNALISYATAISSTSPSSTQTQSTTSTSSPTATAIIDITTPYFIELLGYNSTDNSAWGVTFESQDESGNTYTENHPILIGAEGYAPGNFTKCNDGYEILYASTNSDPNPTSLFAVDYSLVLGPGWSLQESNNISDCTSFKEIPTVPFAFNLGSAEAFNGSVVLGGWYDTNRIASTAWHLVPESVGNDSFPKTGKLDMSVMVGSQSYNAMLNYDETIFFPNALRGACHNDSLVISFPGANGQAALDIPIDLKFLENVFCQDFASPFGDIIVLGTPFFQAAYTYVDKSGQVYLTAANELNATSISMEPFDANATLKLPAGVTAYTAPSVTKKSMAASNFTPGLAILPFGVEWNVVFLGLLAAWFAI